MYLGGVADQSLSIGSECHIGGRDAVPLVVGDDLNTPILEHAHAEKNTARHDKIKKSSLPLKKQGHHRWLPKNHAGQGRVTTRPAVA